MLDLVIQFDDNGESVRTTAFPLMQARNIPGSVAVISDSIGQDAWNGYNRLTVAEMLEMKAAGWDFTNHTKSHQQNVLPTDSEANCLTEIATCREALQTNGLGNGISEYCFCAPYGEYGTPMWAAAASDGVKLYRGTVGDAGFTPSVAEGGVMYSPGIQVPCHYVVNTTTTAYILNNIDSGIARNGMIILLFHHIVTSPGTSIEYSTANFTTVLDGLMTRAKNINFLNMSQLYLRNRL